jgi:hypothetical protein
MNDLGTMTQERWDVLSPAERVRMRDVSDLIPDLIGHEGERICALYPATDGYAQWSQRYYVGMSRGWKPVHIQLSYRNSKDGPPVYWPAGTTFCIISKPAR